MPDNDIENEIVEAAEEIARPRKAVGYPLFMLGLLLASILGAAGGGL